MKYQRCEILSFLSKCRYILLVNDRIKTAISKKLLFQRPETDCPNISIKTFMKYPCFNTIFKSFGTIFSKSLEKALFLLKMRKDLCFEILSIWDDRYIYCSTVKNDSSNKPDLVVRNKFRGEFSRIYYNLPCVKKTPLIFKSKVIKFLLTI